MRIALPLFLAALLSTAPPLHAGVLTFDSVFDQTYGDVAGRLDVSYQGQSPGVAPGALSWWDVGYDELRGVAWFNRIDVGTVARIELRVLDGQEATLHGFRLGSWDGTGLGRRESIDVYRLEDTGAAAYHADALIGAGNLSTLFEPGLRSTRGFLIEWSNPWWTAIDDIRFDLAAAAGVPVAGSLSLTLAALAAMAVRRGRPGRAAGTR